MYKCFNASFRFNTKINSSVKRLENAFPLLEEYVWTLWLQFYGRALQNNTLMEEKTPMYLTIENQLKKSVKNTNLFKQMH